MKRKYDTTFIIDGNLPDTERQALIERFTGVVSRNGGEMEQIIRWGQRTLAYPINKRSHGYYVIFYYTAEPTAVMPFERELRLNEYILRYMTLLFDGKHPEYIRDEGSSDTESAAVKPTDESTEESAGETIEEPEDVFEEEEEEVESEPVIEEDISEENTDVQDKEKE